METNISVHHLHCNAIQVADDSRLERWLIRCKNSTERVKRTLDLHYTLKTNVPEIMTGWDTHANWFKSISSSV
jgi:hypothetical protein